MNDRASGYVSSDAAMNWAGVILAIDAIGVPVRRAATVRARLWRAVGRNWIDPSSESSYRS